MPQFQVLEPNPGFGSQLGKALGGGIGQGLSSQLNQMLDQKQKKEALQGLRPIFKGMDMADEDIDLIEASGLSPEVALKAGELYNKRKITQQGVGEGQESFNEMAKVLKGGKVGFWNYPNVATAEGRKQRAKFDAARPRFLQAIRKLEQTGHITAEDRKQLLKSIPESHDSEATIEGKMEELARTLKLDPGALYADDESEIGGEESSQQQEQPPGPLKKVAPGTPLPDDVAQQIFQQAKGNPERARELAKQMGYKLD